MKKSHVLGLASLAVFAVLAAGCGKKIVINTPNGNVNGTIDVNTNSANLNINGTTLKTGDVVSLPSDFPTDVYVIDGTIKTSISTPGVGYTVALTTTKTVNEAKALYDQKLKDNGWTLATSGVIDTHSAAVIAQKGATRSVTVAISDTDGPTVVTITATSNAATNSATSM